MTTCSFSRQKAWPLNGLNAVEEWTDRRIKGECSKPYRLYEQELKQHYLSYFDQNPKLRCPHQAHSALSIAAALPPGSAQLQELIPRNAIHPYARSAKSSQMLALAILGASAMADPSHEWLWKAANLPRGLGAQNAGGRVPFMFERQLAPSDLNETPHTTQIDYAVDAPSCFVAIECKWSEQGLGGCSCLPNHEGNPMPGGFCSQRVVERPEYWQMASDFFGLSAERLPLLPCQISPLYQAVRNVAAARCLAGSTRPFAFILLFDNQNPYFRATGEWPGWPALLENRLRGHEARGLYFRALAWQDIINELPLDPGVRVWAREKHRLE